MKCCGQSDTGAVYRYKAQNFMLGLSSLLFYCVDCTIINAAPDFT